MNTKPICVYHGNCADGFGAALAVWDATGERYDFVPGFYDKEFDLLNELTVARNPREILFVDFCLKLPQLEVLLDRGIKITVLDHHVTAKDDVQPLIETGRIAGVFDMERSGAMITWQEFHNGEPPKLYKHIQDRDLWQFKLDGTREIQQALFSYPYDFATWQRFLGDDAIPHLRDEGAAILRKHWKDINEFIEAGFVRNVCVAGHMNIPLINVPYTMGSDTCHALCERNPEAAFSMYYYDTHDKRQYGMRSLPDGANVGTIAKAFGGGGHAHASGFHAQLNTPQASLTALADTQIFARAGGANV